MTAEDRLDEMIMDSFPASDPPSYWASSGDADDGVGHESKKGRETDAHEGIEVSPTDQLDEVIGEITGILE